jgi:group I intron endonuclease
MTTGIYRLIFPNTDKCYVGQSVNIERRYLQHLRAFEQNTAAKKLQKAYLEYGKPSLDILLELKDRDELDKYENEAIEIFNSYHNGFNSLEHAEDIPDGSKYGLEHHNSKYTEDQLYDVMLLLAKPGVSLIKISEETGVSISIISLIQKGNNHKWLKEKYPTEYGNMLVGHRNSYLATKSITPLVLSPSGSLHQITHLSNFAKENNLDHSALSRLIRGKQQVHKGWKLYEQT